MIVQHAFTVNAPSERVFAALADLRLSGACLPATRLENVAGEVATGRVRLPRGAATHSYRGTLRLSDADAGAGSLRALLEGARLRGGATASAEVEVRLRESNGLTTASLRGELRIDGRATELGGDTVQRTVSALLRRFGRCLEEAMAQGAEPGARVDHRERLEETIAALSQLERLTTGPAPAGRGTASGPAPPAEPQPDARTIPGRVQVVTTAPVVMAKTPSRRDRTGDRLDERPWLVPAGLMAALLAWVMVRRRD